MQITIFVEPNSFKIFVEIMTVLQDLDIDNNYVFNPSDLVFKDTFVSNYIQLTIDLEEYMKFLYCYRKLKGEINN